MLNKSANNFERFATHFGLSIKIPRPKRTARGVFGITNGLIGIALITSGAICKKPSLVLLGALGVVGAIILSFDKQ